MLRGAAGATLALSFDGMTRKGVSSYCSVYSTELGA